MVSIFDTCSVATVTRHQKCPRFDGECINFTSVLSQRYLSSSVVGQEKNKKIAGTFLFICLRANSRQFEGRQINCDKPGHFLIV